MDPSDLENLYAGLDRNVDQLYDAAQSDALEGLAWTDGGGEERYKRGAELGVGGAKIVYLAYDRAIEQQVAMATLRTCATEVEAADFHREARLTASLDHPNIIRVFDIGLLVDGAPFFTMSLLPGESLTEVISGDSIPPISQLLEIMLKVCDALAFAHEQGVMHLDLKPDNIQIGSFGEVLVCDWGVAKHRMQGEGPTFPTGVATVKGTPAYMAPEQAEGSELTTSADVYALGSILYTMLARTHPYFGFEPGDLLKAVRNGVPPKALASFVELKMPPALIAVVEKAMASNRGDRYASVSAFRDDLERYLHGYATEAEDASLWTLLKLICQRYQSAAFVSLVAMVLVTGLTVWYVSGLNQSREAAIVAQEDALDQMYRAEAAEQSAVRQRDLAQAERERSVALLAAFQREQEETVKLAGMVADLRHLSARAALLDHRFDDAATAYVGLAAKYPDDRQIWQEKAVVHLVRQEFSAAYEAFTRANNASNRPLMELSHRLSELKPDDDELLPSRAAGEFIESIPSLRPGIKLRAFVYLVQKLEPGTCLPIVEVVLNGGKPKHELMPVLSSGDEGTQLAFRSSKRRVLASVLWEPDYPRAVCLFTCLKPTQMDLSNLRLTHIDDLRYIRSLTEVVLPLNAVDLSPLNDLANLKIVTIPSKIYSRDQLRVLNKSVTVRVDQTKYSSDSNR